MDLYTGKMQEFERAQRHFAGKLLWLNADIFFQIEAMAVWSLSLLVLRWKLWRKKISLWRVRKKPSLTLLYEITVIFAIKLKAVWEKKMCIFSTWKISWRKAIEIGSPQIKIPGEYLVLSIDCWKSRKSWCYMILLGKNIQ